MTEKHVLAVLLLDETGSMQSIKQKTISSINEYVEGLLPHGKQCHLTLVKFNSAGTNFLCNDVPVKDVPKLTEKNYLPSHNTPLLDAVAKTIKETDEKIRTSKLKPDVLFIVLTDGEENDSREYNQKQVSDLIITKEKDGWTMVYLGANQDSWTSAHALGYGNRGTVANFKATPEGITEVMATNYAATNRYFHRRTIYGSSEAGITGAAFADTNFMAAAPNTAESLDKDIAEFKARLKEKEEKKDGK